MASRFSETSGSLGGAGAVASGAGAVAVADADGLAGASAFAVAFAVFGDVFSDFKPDPGAVVSRLARAGIAPSLVFAADATAGSVLVSASLAGFDGCAGASFFAAGSGSDFAGGVVGRMEAILSFSTSTYP